MKSNKRIKSLFLALSAIATTAIAATPVKAVSFQEQRVNQDDFAVVAVPFGYQQHRLEIIEQIPGEKQCWQESGSAPVKMDLLLLEFDHTNSCRRVMNTNGYTLRLNGEEDLATHVVKIVPNNGELQLVAFHRDSTQPNIVIGSTNGMTDGAVKINLKPGWQITKRVHEGKTLNHLYLSGNGSQTYTANPKKTTTATSNPTPQTTPQTAPSPKPSDLANSIDQIYNNIVSPLLRDLSQENEQQQ